MTVRTAPRMIPRRVSSLKSPAATGFGLLAILISPLEIRAVACRRRRRVPPNDLPPPVIEHPYVREQHAILDRATEVCQPPPRVHGANHDIIKNGGVMDVERDIVDLAVLDRFQ